MSLVMMNAAYSFLLKNPLPLNRKLNKSMCVSTVYSPDTALGRIALVLISVAIATLMIPCAKVIVMQVNARRALIGQYDRTLLRGHVRFFL